LSDAFKGHLVAVCSKAHNGCGLNAYVRFSGLVWTMQIMTAKDQKDIIGIIFPLLRSHVQRFLEGRKKVFVKFCCRETAPVRSQLGSRLFFYESRGSKEIVGEARISEVSSGTIEEVLSRFGDNLFLTRDELEEYARGRRAKKMLVLVAENAKRYTSPLKLNEGITMAGRYMRRELWRSLGKGRHSLSSRDGRCSEERLPRRCS